MDKKDMHPGLVRVINVMNDLEGVGGPEGRDYIHVMEQIELEARERVRVCRLEAERLSGHHKKPGMK